MDSSVSSGLTIPPFVTCPILCSWSFLQPWVVSRAGARRGCQQTPRAPTVCRVTWTKSGNGYRCLQSPSGFCANHFMFIMCSSLPPLHPHTQVNPFSASPPSFSLTFYFLLSRSSNVSVVQQFQRTSNLHPSHTKRQPSRVPVTRWTITQPMIRDMEDRFFFSSFLIDLFSKSNKNKF